jgi:DUF971 family protein
VECDAAGREAAGFPIWPSSIELHKRSRTLALEWGKANVALPHKVLRQACRCAECESSRRHGRQAAPVAEDVELLRMEFVGETGLRFFFSDGHDRGIFPWIYLFRLAFAPA